MVFSVEGTEFTVKDGLVAEVGTTLRYDPSTGCGFQLVDGRRVGLKSYGAFGDDLFKAEGPANDWERKAKTAWAMYRATEQHDEVEALSAENAKLRELAKEMFYSLLNVAGGRRTMTAGEAQNLMDRMRELGIEVDE